MTRHKDAERLQEHLRFERFLSKSAATLMSVSIEEMDQAVHNVLRGLVEVLDVDRSALAKISADGTSLVITHCHSTPGSPGLPLNVDLKPARPWQAAQIASGRPAVFHLPDELPPEAMGERDFAVATGMKSHASLPMKVAGEIIGTLGVSCFRKPREFSDEILGRLELLAGVFASAVYRRAAQERLLAAQDLNESVLASVASKIVVLDREGRVAAVNKAWESFERRERFPRARVGLGANYLDVLARAASDGVTGAAAERAAGIRSVLSGQCPRFDSSYAYPYSSGTRFFLMNATRLSGPTGGAVVVHTDVTELEEAKQGLERALHEVRELKERLEAENVLLHEEVRRSFGFDEIVGTSAALARVLREVEQVAPTGAPVLILGETGTGKDMLALATHDRSPRKNRTLVTVNCAALPPTLIESELFGYERGAFTGAVTRSLGRFEAAHGGTILLDEIGELPLEVQAKLLRVLETGEIERLGSSKTIKVDVRVIAATNRDLEKEVREGSFRADLFYRLSVFPISVPPLRERPDDIPLLVWHFVLGKQARLDRSIERVPEALMRALVAYSWPGNVRELENVIERALILSSGPTLATPPSFLNRASSPPFDGARLEDVERAHVLAVLAGCGWKISGKGNAAERLGVNRSTLQFRMKKLGIQRPRAQSD